MGLFSRKKQIMENKFFQLNELLKSSFGNVKQDILHLSQWMNYVYQKTMQQDQKIMEMKFQLQHMPSLKQQVKEIIDENYAYEEIKGKIKNLEQKIDNLKPDLSIKEHPRLIELQKRLEAIEDKKPSFKEKLIKKITKSSKDYVKSVVLGYIKKYGEISALQLKEMVVDEQLLCSKSSFYRILEEVEAESDEISVMKKGKEKNYISKIAKKI